MRLLRIPDYVLWVGLIIVLLSVTKADNEAEPGSITRTDALENITTTATLTTPATIANNIVNINENITTTATITTPATIANNIVNINDNLNDTGKVPVPTTTLSTSVSSTQTTKLPETMRPIEDLDQNTCSLKCQNQGLCRRRLDQSGDKCVCKLDFTGDLCEAKSEPDLRECTETTCKNGGICVSTGNAPYCQCPENVKGWRCERRLTWFELGFIPQENNGNMKWNDLYSNLMDPNTKRLSEKLCNFTTRAIQSGHHFQLVNSVEQCIVESFENDPVFVKLQLRLDFLQTDLAQDLDIAVKTQLRSGASHLWSTHTSSYQGVTAFYNTQFSVKLLDPCKVGNHDCSVNARCVDEVRGTYSCVCNPLTIDSSLDPMYPGRRCLNDALIVFTLAITGGIVSTIIILLCGCRSTIWRRRHAESERINLVNMPRTYEI